MFRTQVSDQVRAVASARQQAQTIKNEFVAATAKEQEAAALEEIQAEQLRSEVKELRLERVRPTVLHILANEVNSDVAINTANLDLIAGDMLANERAFTAQGVCDAITALGSKLGRKPAPTDQELRDQMEAEMAQIIADVKIPEDWSERDKKLKREGIRVRLENDHNRFAAKLDGGYIVSTAQMRQELENLQNSRAFRRLSHHELQTEVKAQRKPNAVAQVPAGTPILDPSITRHALTKYKPEELRTLKLVMDQRHGVGAGEVAITARLSGADAQEIKRIYQV